MARRRKRGTGGITQRANGSWTAQVTLSSRGGRIRRTYTSPIKGDVEFWLREASRSVRVGEGMPDSRRTVDDQLEGWLLEVGTNVRPTTLRVYTIHVEKWIHPIIGDIPLVDLTTAHVRRVRDHVTREGRSPRTAALVLQTLRMGLRQGVRDGRMARNVAEGVKPPRQTPRLVVATSPAEARAIIDAFAGHRLEVLVTTALGTGMRLGELLGLRWQDIHGGQIRVNGALRPVPRAEGKGYVLDRVSTKTTRSVRTLELPEFVATALEVQRKRQAQAGTVSTYVFATPAAGPLDPKNTTRSFQLQLAAAGLPRMRFHDLRHAAATVMLAVGVPLRVIQEALGHRDITTTAAIYAHVLPSLQEDAAARLDAAIGGGSKG